MASVDKILVIDDDQVVCEIVSAIAQAMGLDCDVTRSPLTFFDRVTPDTSSFCWI